MPTRPLPTSQVMYKGTPPTSKTGGAGNQLPMMQGAIKRRMTAHRPQGGAGQAVGGGPISGKPAGSIIKPPKKGALSTFVTENWQQKNRRF